MRLQISSGYRDGELEEQGFSWQGGCGGLKKMYGGL